MEPELKKILVVDDEASMRHMLHTVLEKEGYQVTETARAETGLELLEEEPFDIALCDIRMPGMDGKIFLQEAVERGLPVTIIMMSAYGSFETAVECMKLGAYDYLSKPFKPDEVVLTLRKAEERLRLRRENLALREELARGAPPSGMQGIVYRSQEMEQVLTLVKRVADTSSPVLITGETGTGKELVARALHAESGRSEGPFVAVNCGAISSSLMESELFGHVKGAFTGADRARQGLFSAADGGTLFLDEIGELPLDLQPKLLRVLQEKEIRRIGETKPRQVDVRVLAATGRDLQEEVEKGRFRDDLYYRLAVMDLRIPPLRERPEDIPVLAEYFVRQIAEREGRPVPEITEDALAVLKEHRWSGNVRELENFMEKTMIFCRDDRIELTSLPWEVRRRNRGGREEFSLKKAAKRLEQEYIKKALAATEGNRTQAAKLLEISLRNLLYKMKDYDID